MLCIFSHLNASDGTSVRLLSASLSLLSAPRPLRALGPTRDRRQEDRSSDVRDPRRAKGGGPCGSAGMTMRGFPARLSSARLGRCRRDSEGTAGSRLSARFSTVRPDRPADKKKQVFKRFLKHANKQFHQKSKKQKRKLLANDFKGRRLSGRAIYIFEFRRCRNVPSTLWIWEGF